MVPNRILRVVGCVAVAAVAFGLTGCGGSRKPPARVTKSGKQQPAPEPPPEAVAEPEAVFGPPILRDRIAAGRAAGLQPAIKLPGVRSSKPHAKKDEALADALTMARLELMKHLEAMDPPIHARPSLVAMKQEYVKGDAREEFPTDDQKSLIKASGVNPNVRWVVIDLELTEDQVQRLRSSERVTDAFRGGAIVLAFLAAIYGFLRLDQWTKGYLTMWLGLGAGLLVGGVALLVLV